MALRPQPNPDPAGGGRLRLAAAAFDPWRPFRSHADAFTPRDTIPWQAKAELFLRCRTSEGYVGLRPFARIRRNVAAIVEALRLPAGARVLDVGCGPGLYCRPLAERGYRVTGIDIAGPVLEYARADADRLGVSARYERCSVFELASEAEFDAVLLLDSPLCQWAEAEQDEAFARIRRALVPGGTLLCEVQAPGSGLEEASIREAVALFPVSPWCARPHLWLTRRLTFPEARQQVVHHLILPEHGPLEEYWSRSSPYRPDAFVQQLARRGLEPWAVVGAGLDRAPHAGEECFFVYARRRL